MGGKRGYIRERCRQCLTCQKSKITQYGRAPAHQNQYHPGHFQVWYLNLKRPLPNSGGCRCILACLDRFTHWVEAILVADAIAALWAEDFMANIIAQFGVPSQIVGANGPAFTARLFKNFCFQLGMHLTHSIPYPLASNAMVERTFCALKSAVQSKDYRTNFFLRMKQRTSPCYVQGLQQLDCCFIRCCEIHFANLGSVD